MLGHYHVAPDMKAHLASSAVHGVGQVLSGAIPAQECSPLETGEGEAVSVPRDVPSTARLSVNFPFHSQQATSVPGTLQAVVVGPRSSVFPTPHPQANDNEGGTTLRRLERATTPASRQSCHPQAAVWLGGAPTLCIRSGLAVRRCRFLREQPRRRSPKVLGVRTPKQHQRRLGVAQASPLQSLPDPAPPSNTNDAWGWHRLRLSRVFPTPHPQATPTTLGGGTGFASPESFRPRTPKQHQRRLGVAQASALPDSRLATRNSRLTPYQRFARPTPTLSSSPMGTTSQPKMRLLWFCVTAWPMAAPSRAPLTTSDRS